MPGQSIPQGYIFKRGALVLEESSSPVFQEPIQQTLSTRCTRKTIFRKILRGNHVTSNDWVRIISRHPSSGPPFLSNIKKDVPQEMLIYRDLWNGMSGKKCNKENSTSRN
ncbi:unnamed protein product [Rhizophagus irregularis]|nr:unnamed protein product [Rhizophagus irregularis]CAB5364509.1 unnamed protein product [Rhizophagus irregularis]